MILVLAHGHPDFGAGGAELAAYTLFRALLARGEDVHFLARTGETRLPPGAVGSLRPREWLIRRDIADWSRLDPAPDEAPEGRGLPDLLRRLAPDTVFVHHYVHLGLPILADLRRALPHARIVLTLHDFLALCPLGTMVTPAGRLCDGPDACHDCLPQRNPAELAERPTLFRRAFAAADILVSPSRFLARRLEAAGFGPVFVAPNGIAPAAVARTASPMLRLGLFGQARPEKGLHVALAAVHHLPQERRGMIRLAVHMSRLEAQPGWYRELVRRLAEPLIAAGVVTVPGTYTRSQLSDRMGETDAVLVPSTWWENAPLVIGEAFAHHRPVIGSRVGGIAEMVRDGEDGLLFERGDATALANAIGRLVGEPDLLARLSAGTRRPPTPEAMAAAYMALAGGREPPLRHPRLASLETTPAGG